LIGGHRTLHEMQQSCYTGLGLSYEAAGDKEQARSNFRGAIEVAPQERWTNTAREHLAKLQE